MGWGEDSWASCWGMACLIEAWPWRAKQWGLGWEMVGVWKEDILCGKKVRFIPVAVGSCWRVYMVRSAFYEGRCSCSGEAGQEQTRVPVCHEARQRMMEISGCMQETGKAWDQQPCDCDQLLGQLTFLHNILSSHQSSWAVVVASFNLPWSFSALPSLSHGRGSSNMFHGHMLS